MICECMNTIARNVVQIYYKNQLYLTLDFGYNSSQLEEIIADNVNKLPQESTFHVSLMCDANVGFPFDRSSLISLTFIF